MCDIHDFNDRAIEDNQENLWLKLMNLVIICNKGIKYFNNNNSNSRISGNNSSRIGRI